jgi:hypothetical protein
MFTNNEIRSDISFARDIKTIKSKIKKELKKQTISLNDLFEVNNPYYKYIGNLKVYKIIMSLPGFGTVRTDEILKKLKISRCKKINGLGSRQKRAFENFFGITI